MGVLIFSLAGLSIALAIQRAFLSGRQSALRAREQAYQFHALRDELQLCAVKGRVEKDSLAYSFLTQILNLAIKNAGMLKLREILALAAQVRREVEETRFEAICADIQRRDAEVRALAERIFSAFAVMLITNDWLVSAGVKVHRNILGGWEIVRPAFRILDRIVTALLTVFAPLRIEAFKEARRYTKWAERVGTC